MLSVAENGTDGTMSATSTATTTATQQYSYEINISQHQPIWLAQPIYGIAAPLITLLTLVTNSLVVIVLSHKNLRTPTNYILLSMAITELMTGLSTSPWFLYYYTFGGHEVDESVGLPDFWCRYHFYFACHLPTIFHTAAIWLTVFLAVQRYIYVCLPSLVIRYCNPRLTCYWIAGICSASIFFQLPLILAENHFSVEINGHRQCVAARHPIVDEHLTLFYTISLLGRAVLVHIIPCLLLIIFTTCLFRTINEADRKRSVHVMASRRNNPSNTSNVMSSNRLMHATTKMLVVVIAIFLIIEIPLAVIFVFHLAITYFQIAGAEYVIINHLLIVRNFMIIVTYPLNFAIYFGMSSSFKLQFRQMFTRKILYITSPNADNVWRPRFSVQLIDIHKIRTPSQIFSRRNTTSEKVSGHHLHLHNIVVQPPQHSYIEDDANDELL